MLFGIDVTTHVVHHWQFTLCSRHRIFSTAFSKVLRSNWEKQIVIFASAYTTITTGKYACWFNNVIVKQCYC